LTLANDQAMFKGTVTFRARIKGNGLTVPLCEFNPNEPGVETVEVESPNGDEFLSTVHLASVATPEDGKAIATKVNTAALNRISFFHRIAIEDSHNTSAQFSPLNPEPFVLAAAPGELLIVGEAVKLVIGIPAARLKTELEHSSPPGEQYFGLFRSARLSMSSVEEFMHLYHILLMLFNDSQSSVDRFIVGEDPAVPQTPDPRPRTRPLVMETVYTRLRNEFAHKRAGVNLDNTKAEMANRLGGLIALVTRAIELHP
jgi:hypothetical protein